MKPVLQISGMAGLLGAALVALPLLGAISAGQPLAQYLELPPLTRYVEHAGFSWIAFVLLAALVLTVILPFIVRVMFPTEFARQVRVCPPPLVTTSSSSLVPIRRFPWWGWLGAGMGIIAWVLAWSRFDWFASLQQFTFSPLWLAYILVVNALAYRRTGGCMLTRQPVYFLLLFPVSAAFWWFFEYLNRFVQNWYYVGIDNLTAEQYFLFATLPFSTVLPAVMGTHELLTSFPRLSAGLDDCMRLDVRRPKIWAAAILLLAGAGLAGIGLWPDYLFPLLWLSPLCIIAALQALSGHASENTNFRTQYNLDNPMPFSSRRFKSPYPLPGERIEVRGAIGQPAPHPKPSPKGEGKSFWTPTSGYATIFAPLRDGDWRNIFLCALAALICGFFWEMWNYFSLAKWIYAVPFVGRFKIFEMPVLGYAGYLPFGLECALIAGLVEQFLKDQGTEPHTIQRSPA